jgi:hypothetical protein
MGTRSLSVLAALALWAAPLAAQETTGTIAGRIVDAQNLSMPGVSVTVAGPQGAKSTVTSTDGRFSIPFLTPGTYSIRAELQGFKTFRQSNVTVSLGQTMTIPIKMSVGGVTEVVNVTVAPPAIDTTSTTTGAVISNDLITRVPTGRRMSDTLYIAPGVSSSGTAGTANPSLSGGSGLDNQYVIDGVNVTSAGYGGLGSYSIEFGSLGNSTPFDFIKEVQVKTGGYEAEFGEALGGMVNVVTKSGSNDLRGSAFGYWRPTGLESPWNPYQSTDYTTVQTLGSREEDAGVEGGGPVIKNHLFFYGAIDPTWNYRTFEAPATRPLLSLGGVNRERRNVNYAAKGTWQISNGHRLEASFFGDPSTGFNGPQRPTALIGADTSAYSSLTYGGHNQTVSYNGVLNSHWLVESYWARSDNQIAELPSVNSWRITDRTVSPRVVSGGVGFFEGGNNSLDNQYSVKATNILGSHEVKYGIEYDHVNYLQSTQYSGPSIMAPNGQMTTSGALVTILPDLNFGQIYQVTRAKLSAPPTTVQNYVDAFVQDTWHVGDRLTVNPGIRWEQERQQGSLESLSLTNNWSPRIGATYDVMGNGRSKIYGSFGRFYARMPNDLAARALSVDNLISRADYYDPALTQPIAFGVVTQVPGGSAVTNHFIPGSTSPDTIDPNIKMSYANEFMLGFEAEALPLTTFGVRYIHRDIGRVLEDVQTAPYVPYYNGDPAVTYNYFLTNPSSATQVTPAVPGYTITFPDPVHRYNAVEFTAERRLSNHWSATASYRWSRLRGNYEGFYNNLIGQSDPGITALFDFPANDPSYTALGAALGLPGDIRYLADPNGILSLDQPHAAKLYGTYEYRGVNFGVAFNAHSGLPLTPLAYSPAYGENDIPAAPLGSGIQTIDGFESRTPFQTSTDLQASYTFPMTGRSRVTVLADVFNLFNQQTTLLYDTFTEQAQNIANPDFGQPVSQIAGVFGPQFADPRAMRIGVRIGF